MTKLDGSLAKLSRAREQIEGLESDITATIERKTYRPVVAERDSDPKYAVLRVRTDKEGLPWYWSPVIGEIAHDLRSALDLLACQLALLKHPTQRDFCEQVNVNFPLFLFGSDSRKPVRERWRRVPRGRKNVGTGWYFKRQHRAKVERLQPYHRWNGQRHSPLWLLHELNNADKHRYIQVIAMSVALVAPKVITLTRNPDDITKGPFLQGIEFYEGVPLIDGAKIGRVSVELHGGSVEMEVSIASQVTFHEGCDAVKGLPVVLTLERMFNAVFQAVNLFLADPKFK